jgi:hypothetical protein
MQTRYVFISRSRYFYFTDIIHDVVPKFAKARAKARTKTHSLCYHLSLEVSALEVSPAPSRSLRSPTTPPAPDDDAREEGEVGPDVSEGGEIPAELPTPPSRPPSDRQGGSSASVAGLAEWNRPSSTPPGDALRSKAPATTTLVGPLPSSLGGLPTSFPTPARESTRRDVVTSTELLTAPARGLPLVQTAPRPVPQSGPKTGGLASSNSASAPPNSSGRGGSGTNARAGLTAAVDRPQTQVPSPALLSVLSSAPARVGKAESAKLSEEAAGKERELASMDLEAKTREAARRAVQVGHT